MITKTAESASATAELIMPYNSHYHVTFNDVALTQQMPPSLDKTAGKENIIISDQHTGAEEFSFFSKKFPDLKYYFGGYA